MVYDAHTTSFFSFLPLHHLYVLIIGRTFAVVRGGSLKEGREKREEAIRARLFCVYYFLP